MIRIESRTYSESASAQWPGPFSPSEWCDRTWMLEGEEVDLSDSRSVGWFLRTLLRSSWNNRASRTVAVQYRALREDGSEIHNIMQKWQGAKLGPRA